MDIKTSIKKHYMKVAEQSSSCCPDSTGISFSVGYDREELAQIPQQANLGLGCGNPVREAMLQPGEQVLDLGCGAGMDVFLASQYVGAQGHVHGVDMTEGMIKKATSIAEEKGFSNVSFYHAPIEALPLEDQSVDVILSNCVINLSLEKEQVFRETLRVLRPGGRLCISDTLLLQDLPQEVLDDPAMYGC